MPDTRVAPAPLLDPNDILHASILIVDDEAVNVTLLAQMLAQAGYDNVSTTSEPREVCAVHRKNGYDLILLDLQMPGMDGFQVMEGLKADARDAYLPVLVITARPEHKLRALSAGARDFVGKPFDLPEVNARIHNMLEVRLLYKRLEAHGKTLEAAVRERTAELRESEARFRSLTELASDWYWEQDAQGAFTKVSGPVLEMLGLQGEPDGAAASDAQDEQAAQAGWNPAERAQLHAAIAARRPFLDFVFSRSNPDGSEQRFQVSGEPMFGPACQFLGYRGVGLEITRRP